ncbi:MAG TPA: tRNA pseudouridine(55) synthase TruB [Vulgatibacter sp.]|nr:tRNA pseudouridine(55) synthase TruB [Vulgatibacter sp.]
MTAIPAESAAPRGVDGVVVVDKPAGPTSFDVVRRLRRFGRDRKAGHTGTLDPMATGVLPICLGDATKIASFITDGDKEYEGVVALGVETDTYDATGTVVAEARAEGLERERVEDAVAAMAGVYWQTPPMFSAVKVQGRRLYELARKGEEIERRPRKVRIERIELRAWDPGAARATIFVRCGKGTYVRSIAHELGVALGVGGHLASLRRLRSGPFGIERAVPLAALLEGGLEAVRGSLVPLRDALPELREIVLDEARTRKVAHGMSLGGRDLAECRAPRLAPGERVRLTDASGRLLAVAEADAGALRYLRVLAAAGARGGV